MTIEPVEPRRLRAAVAVLFDNGTLGVAGTDESEHIRVAASRVAFDRGSTVGRVADYVVTIDGRSLGTFAGERVRRINVFALGGRDHVDGPTAIGPRRNVDSIEDLKYVAVGTDGFRRLDIDDAKDPTLVVAPMYVEGGSGSDHLNGSYGNDTLKGGSGDDYLSDGLGRNAFDGGEGNDLILTFRSARVFETGGTTYTFVTDITPRPAYVRGGAGDDTLRSLADDVLLDTPEHRPDSPDAG